MKRSLSRILGLMLAFVMMLGTATAIHAEPFDYGDGVAGTTTTLKKHLVVRNDANIPNAEFTFTVTAGGTAAEATDQTVTVYAGKNPELVKVNGTASSGKVTFTAGETTTAGAADDGITNSVDKKYASKDITLDFSGVKYDKPGVYRYTITETDPTAPIKAVGEKVTTVDVYVEDNDGTLVVTGYVAYDGTVTDAPKSNANAGDITDWINNNSEPQSDDYATVEEYNTAHETWEQAKAQAQATADAAAAAANPNGAEAGTKDDKFVNELETATLKVSKVIAGNQGDKEDTFAFEIKLTNAGNGTIIKAGTVDSGKTLPSGITPETTTYTTDADGKLTINITLGHNEQLVLTGIPKGASYTVNEVPADDDSKKTADGYTAAGEVLTALELSAEVASHEVTNTRNGVIPTGLITSVLPGALLVGGAAVYFLTKKKDEDED